MAVAYDAASESHTGTTGATATYSWTHTPVGTPAGVLLFVHNAANAFPYGAVTYGGVAMTAVTSGDATDTAGEAGTVRAYFLGSGIPTGAQTVQVVESGTMTNCYAVCFTVTAGDDTDYAGVVTEAQNQTLTEQAVDDGSPGTNSVRFAGIYQGGSSVASAGANSTAGPSIDYGTRVFGTYRETSAGQGSRNVGCTQGTSDDVAAVYLAIIEVASTSPEASSAYSDMIVADAPIGFWRLGEDSGTTVLDYSGAGHDGTASAVTLGAADVSPDDDGAMTFVAASDSVVTVPDFAGLDDGDLSIEAWVSFDAIDGSSWRVIVGKEGWTAGDGWFLYWRSSPGQIGFGTGGVDPPEVRTNDFTPDLNTPYHIVATYDDSGSVGAIWVDGVERAIDGGTISITGNSNTLNIGARHQNDGTSSHDSFDGDIDDVAIYDYILTSTQIGDHFAGGGSGSPVVLEGAIAATSATAAASLDAGQGLEAPASASASSTAAAQLDLAEGLDAPASVGASSAAAAQLDLLAALESSIAATSSAAAAELDLLLSLEGSTTAASAAATAELDELLALLGTTAGVSATEDADLHVATAVPLEGLSTAVSSTGDAVLDVAVGVLLYGLSAGVSATSADLIMTLALAGESHGRTETQANWRARLVAIRRVFGSASYAEIWGDLPRVERKR